MAPPLLQIIKVALKTSKAYDKLARTLQYGSSFLLVTQFKDGGEMKGAMEKVKATTGSTRRILRWGQFIGVLVSMNYSPETWQELCQSVSDGSLALFYAVENIIYLAKCGVIKVTDKQLRLLTWLSDFFWLFEVLPLVPKYASILMDDKEVPTHLPLLPNPSAQKLDTFYISLFDTLVAAHDLGIKPGVSTPTRHLLGTITSILGLRSVYVAARDVVAEAEAKRRSRYKRH
eukprot:jgi/Bigna1/142022/aug1.66_g16730